MWVQTLALLDLGQVTSGSLLNPMDLTLVIYKTEVIITQTFLSQMDANYLVPAPQEIFDTNSSHLPSPAGTSIPFLSAQTCLSYLLRKWLYLATPSTHPDRPGATEDIGLQRTILKALFWALGTLQALSPAQPASSSHSPQDPPIQSSRPLRSHLSSPLVPRLYSDLLLYLFKP